MSNAEKTVMFALPNLVSGQLACVAGTAAGRSWDLSAGTFTIGRLEEHDMALSAEPGVSKIHAKIIGQGDSYLIVDVESRNGTLLNGELIQKADLYDGDEIRICGCILRFTQKGGPKRPPRRQAAPPPDDQATAAFIQPATAPPAMAAAMPMSAPAMTVPPMAMPIAVAAPATGRILAGYYVAGLLGSLLIGGAASAALLATAPPVAVAVATDGAQIVAAATTTTTTPPDAATAKTGPAAVEPAAVEPAAVEPAAVEPAAVEPAAVEPAAVEPAAVEPAAVEPIDDDEPDTADTVQKTRRRSSGGNTSGPFAASVDAGRSEVLKSRTGGRVKTALSDGAAVQKGTIIVTFESGADASEIATLQDRVASLEAIESEEAKRDLKAARQKLAALEGGQNAAPVTSGMDGKLTGSSVAPGTVVKAGETIGKVVDGDVSTRVRITVARGTRARSGQKVTMNLKSGGSISGTVVAVSGRSVVIDPGSEPADNVESVTF